MADKVEMEDIVRMFWQKECPICGAPVKEILQRVGNTYVYFSQQLCCDNCNFVAFLTFSTSQSPDVIHLVTIDAHIFVLKDKKDVENFLKTCMGEANEYFRKLEKVVEDGKRVDQILTIRRQKQFAKTYAETTQKPTG